MRGWCPERPFRSGCPRLKLAAGGVGGRRDPPLRASKKKAPVPEHRSLEHANLMEGGMLSTQPKITEAELQDAPQARLALDNIALNVSEGRTLNRFALRNKLRAFSSVPRVCTCGLALQWDAGFVHLVRDARGGVRFYGLETCRRVWLCPVCAPRIAWKRAYLLEEQIRQWLGDGHAVLFQTLTFPHDYADPLKESAALAAKAFTAVLSGRRWQEEKTRYGIEGTVRALEVTLGVNGWHPHLHILVFLRKPRGVRARRAIQRNLVQRFSKVVERAGYRTPDPRNCPIEVVHSTGVGQYVAQTIGVVSELTSWHMKKGKGASRTPIQLLRDVAESGSSEDRRRWGEWESGTYRRRQLTYSRGLRRRLGGAPEIDPATGEAAEVENVRTSDSAAITPALWRKIADSAGLDVTLRAAYAKGGYQAALERLSTSLPALSPDYLRTNFLSLGELAEAS